MSPHSINSWFAESWRRRFRGVRLAALLLLLCCAGCVHQHYRPPPDCAAEEPGRATDLPPALDAWPGGVPAVEVGGMPVDVEREGGRHNVSEWLVRRMRSKALTYYTVHGLVYPSAGDNGQPGDQVSLRLYRSIYPGPAPLVVILPIWGTFDYPSAKLAWKLRAHYRGAVHIAVLSAPNRLMKWPQIAAADSEDELLREARSSARRVEVAATDISGLLAWARTQPEIDPRRLMLVGFSIGAIVGSVAAVQEPELLATALVMGAGRPDEVLAYCNRIAGQSREAVSERLGLNHEDYQRLMSQAFGDLDWASQGLRADDPARFLLIDAHSDDCMPASARDALWEGLQRPERLSIKGTHQGAFLSMTVLGLDISNRRILDFFDRRLDLAAGAGVPAGCAIHPAFD